ncbi:MAG: hypothetical protein KDC34_02445 [Saprospiraceae bacterium]|nr:hypothetical protein [Saprospiraceae bacterium]
MNKSIIVFCPNPYSIYTNSVCELLQQKGYSIDTIIVRKFTLNRFFNEFSRDGVRLLKKIWTKLFLKEKAYTVNENNVLAFRKDHGLTIKNIKAFQAGGTKLVYCGSLNDQIVEDTLRQKKEKLIVFTGGGIVRKNILDLAGDGIINCHMGILPKYKGMDLPEWCILEGEIDQLGITLHFMDTGIDTGDILKTIKVPIGNNTDIKTLRSTFEPVMINAMVETVEACLAGTAKPSPQPASENRQYFIVHPRLYSLINKKIQKSS